MYMAANTRLCSWPCISQRKRNGWSSRWGNLPPFSQDHENATRCCQDQQQNWGRGHSIVTSRHTSLGHRLCWTRLLPPCTSAFFLILVQQCISARAKGTRYFLSCPYSLLCALKTPSTSSTLWAALRVFRSCSGTENNRLTYLKGTARHCYEAIPI